MLYRIFLSYHVNLQIISSHPILTKLKSRTLNLTLMDRDYTDEASESELEFDFDDPDLLVIN